MTEAEKVEKLQEALGLVLDDVDYIAGNCGIGELVSAVLSKETLTRVRALRDEVREAGRS